MTVSNDLSGLAAGTSPVKMGPSVESPATSNPGTRRSIEKNPTSANSPSSSTNSSFTVRSGEPPLVSSLLPV
jgi:hypothetical protein